MVGDGRFDVVLDPPDPLSRPEGVELDVALEWARRHAARVVVEVDGARFTAGDEPVGDLPPWPPAGFMPVRRRLPGYEFMDRTAADAPIVWAVLVAIARGWGSPSAGVGEAFGAALEDAEVQVLDPGAGPWEQPGGGALYAPVGVNGRPCYGVVARARFTVEARMRDEARGIARVRVERALDRALESAGIDRAALGSDWDFESLLVYPDGSGLARVRWSLSG